ncbi:MAG: bifunctional folylpolyglutamate synthase/dihydrofolate synthase [Acidobacteria bacterium]|nr:MAG: bifunctional folylpolyglutamate synthase/dihydrofolate synthase [Acidobacteriota bacterium]REK01835.1 MAG: bifunctional folylpolyglutamate synthase/dihydrofolate synthase [Acidobacteriota bacterium]REK14791.1 MAG: bifunctional folylpolyglutamate synthase/dihydrofolate synthase [Acidobacteriota bacterium]REK45506.1 MAG: bifunctional folylpolyglutamate synthase/dihydrofolate synthase [Acidobacteriota bacterium]
MNFAESQDYLLSLGFELSVKKFGLENTQILLEALDHPEEKFLKVQVAGTNGKGSVCAFLEAICLEAGFKIGLNTSPHLVSITERVRIGGKDISEDEFARYTTIVREKGEELVAEGRLQALPTYFEHVTAIALLAFAEANVDLAILETGLGGRFDATTAANSEVAVITPIDLDHMNTLGATIREIASEKAAIISEDSTVVVSDQNREALEVIEARCGQFGIEPIDSSSVTAKDLNGTVTFISEYARYESVTLGLKGRHQVDNARTAIAVAEALARQGFDICPNDVSRGLEKVSHKGRLEYRVGILFDGAHNVSGAKALRAYIEENIDEPITMMFAAMTGKDISEISKILFPLADNLIFVKPENPRAMTTRALAGSVPADIALRSVTEASSVSEAVETARAFAGDGLILVTGSLYLIGEVQAHLQGVGMTHREH